NVKRLRLTQSLFSYVAGKPSTARQKEGHVKDASNNWKITATGVELENNRFTYEANAEQRKTGFDPAHMRFNAVSLKASDAFYSSDSLSVKLLSASAADSAYFVLRNASAELVMTRRSIRAKHLAVLTGRSSISASAELHFSSLHALRDSLRDLQINAEFRKARFAVKDALYFSPALSSIPFFSTAANYATLSGTMKGSIGNLRGHSIVIRSGTATVLKTNFTIRGLPDLKTAFMDVPDLLVESGSKDLNTILGGNIIPKSLTLPETVKVNGSFKGTLKAFTTQLSVNSDLGDAKLTGTLNEAQLFSGDISADKFNVGKLLGNPQLGPLTLRATVGGKGLAPETMTANVSLTVKEALLRGYNYHDLTANVTYDSKVISGAVKLQDEFVRFDLKGFIDLNPGKEHLKLDLDLKGADLQKLKLNKEDLRIALKATADLNGKDINTLNGHAGITGLIVTHNGKTFLLDSLFAAAVNKTGKNEFSMKSAVLTLNYSGDVEPGKLIAELKSHINSYFPISKEINSSLSPAGHFEFELELNDHPILSDVFLPELKEFSGMHAKGSFSGADRQLKVNAGLRHVIYGGIAVKDLTLDVSSDASALTYSLAVAKLSNAEVKIDHFAFLGRLADQKAALEISSIDSAGRKKLLVKPLVMKEDDNYKLSLDPSQFYLMNKQWQIAADNYVLFGKEGLLIHDLAFSRSQSRIGVNSPANKFKDDIDISIKDFSMEDLSGIIERDTSFVRGIINGDMKLKRSQSTYGLIADLHIANMAIRDVPVGDLALKADQSESEKFSFDLSLKGQGNDMNVTGALTTLQGKQTIDLDLTLNPLSLKVAEAISFGEITDASGNLEGTVHLKGSLSDPDISGTLSFKNARFTPHFTNSPLELANESIGISGRMLSFHAFTIADKDKHKAVINGTVDMKQLNEPLFALAVNAGDFMLMNSTPKNNKEIFGRLIVDGRIGLKGSAAFPVVNANLTLKNGTNVTFAVPESKLSTDRGEGVVVFEDTLKLNAILTRNEKTEQQNTGLRGMDISSTIRVEKKAILKLLPDPSGSDSLVVQGNANLSLAIDPSGKVSLTGLYELKGGSYQVSLENLVKKQFRITEGSTISWNGDPLDAEVNINALYTIRTSPIDLVADQVSGLSESDKNGYKQRFPFLVYLKLRGPLMKPEISFEIELPAADKGVLGGTVNAKLTQLNDDPSALNKQVFALLVLGRFIQENPLQSESGGPGAENAVRATVGKFLTSELNQLSSKLVPGVELNFDVQSYDDNVSGGSTAVAVGLKKQLFNEKVSVQVGGTVDVEGEKARQNNASDITGDVLMEYKVTNDGRYRLKGFRRNQYEGAIDGQVLETGGGLLYVKDFDNWYELFRSAKKNAELKTVKK
ncbi:MAG: translocation/assembly module TamB domain-containing protein, partial [Bacteroidia bacterium]